MVYSLFVIETAQVVMNISDVFDLFAVGYGDLDTLDKIHLSWLAVPILTGLGASQSLSRIWLTRRKPVSFIVQCFYGYRIYLLTERSCIPSAIALVCRPYIYSLGCSLKETSFPSLNLLLRSSAASRYT